MDWHFKFLDLFFIVSEAFYFLVELLCSDPSLWKPVFPDTLLIISGAWKLGLCPIVAMVPFII